MSKDKNMKISIGPAPFNWGKTRLIDFYCNEIAPIGVDSVYIGNTICHKRNVLHRDDYRIIIDKLKEKGAKVYYSTLALCTTAEEFDFVKDIYDLFDGIEVNMIGFLNLLKESKFKIQDKDIILGPYLNIYNWRSAAYLTKFNPRKLVAPFELSLDSIAEIAQKSHIPVEITAWGNISTALSWRCYTARAVNRSRENCGMICYEYPEGMTLKSVENEELFKIDGLQVLSSKTHCLLEDIPLLKEAGISSIRIYPQMQNTTEIINAFSQSLENSLDAASGMQQLAPYAPGGFCNGWLWEKAGWEYVAA